MQGMSRYFPIALVVLASSPGFAQVTIQNPKHLEVPEQRVQMLHNIICEVAAKEFHVRKGNVECGLTMVLGEGRSRVAAESGGVYTVYLERWDETTFVVSDMQLSMYRMVTRDRWVGMAREISRRADQISPVSVDRLRGTNGAVGASPPSPGNDCLSAILDATAPTVPKIPCGPVPDQRRGRQRRP